MLLLEGVGVAEGVWLLVPVELGVGVGELDAGKKGVSFKNSQKGLQSISLRTTSGGMTA